MLLPDFPKFAIGIPTLNRWDLLMPSLHLYLMDFPNVPIYIVDNGQQACDVIHPNITYIKNEVNVGVSNSWNRLCRQIFKPGTDNPFALILNDDIYLGKNEYTIGNLLCYQTFAFARSLQDWCAFIMPKTTYDKIGAFDEGFKAYYEDSDYERRLKLSGLGFVPWDVLSPTIYRDNSTGAKDPLIYNLAKQSKKYYLQKWGGLPGQEKFTKPFNQK